ncbi:MAG: hypothetical protein PHU42_02180 [Patescibacteria group bacterium]|nr:hypothetical protein [Patescibacteria group bacterium]
MEKIKHNAVENIKPSFDISEVKAKILDEIETVVIRTQDRDSEGNILVSPDGPRSNLDEQSWKIVRTESFKKWFGDWQGHKDCSVIVDENGEPKVVTHRTYEKEIAVKPPREKFSEVSRFMHFTSQWVGTEQTQRYGTDLHHAFLNIRNLFEMGPGKMRYYQTYPEAKAGFVGNIDDEFLTFLKKKGYDGVYGASSKNNDYKGPLMYTDEYVPLNPPTQILLIDQITEK